MTETLTAPRVDAHDAIDGIALQYDGSTAVFTLTNPERRNAFFPEMRRRLAELLNQVHADSAVRSVVITGHGGHFCSGADLKKVAERSTKPSALELRENFADVHRLLRALTEGAKPVVAAVEGVAYGAGVSVALACDVVVATPATTFGLSFARIGLLPDMGLLATLPKRVGTSRAKRLMMSGAVVAGTEAHAIGMVDELADDGGALTAALATARAFDGCAPLPVALIKSALVGGLDTIDDAMRAEAALAPLVAESQDMVEGMAALRERRPPRFTGR